MKRLAMVLGLVWSAVVGSTTSADAYFLDTPHNESNGIYCYTCHAMSYWTSPPSGGADVTMRNAVCLQCHGEGASDPHKGPSKKPHASSTTSTEKGTWSTECTQCHDVHSQGQLDWSTTDAAGLYLAWGTLSSSGSYLARDLVDSPVYGSTTFNITGVAGQTGWSDTTTWVGKGGRVDKGRATDGSRGLVFVPNRANPNETYEIIGASPSSLKVKGRVATSGLLGKSFGVIYGQSLKSAVLPNGGTTAEAMRNVKLFQPGIMVGSYGGYIDESGSAEPQGLCQVCHDRTVYWKNDGSSTEHNSSNVCGECHNILTGLAGSADHRLFIGDRLGTGCGTCHASEVSAPESGHSGGCNTCHANPKPAINSNPLGNEGGISVLAALSNGGYSFGPRLTDGGGHGINDAGFVVVDCSECHELKRSGVQGGTHGGHGATAFGWDSNCVDCHGPSSKEVARDVHGNLCATCHDPARVAVNDYTVRIEGSSANGIDGSAVGATRLSRCGGCHNTNTPGMVHHTSKNGYAAGGSCAFCHATVGHQGNHTDLVGGYVNCVNCHSANLGSGAGAPVDPIDPKKHDACTTCHNFNTALKTLAQVNTLKVVAMPDGGAGSTNGGGSCLSCHGEYFGNHLQANHLAKVAGHQGCDSCHPGTAGTATTVPTSATDNKLHDDCYTCHQATGALKAGYGKAPGMLSPGGDCTSCHGVYFPNHQINHAARVAGTTNCTGCHTGTAGTATTIPVNASDNKVHDACATCHDDQSTNLLKAPYGKASAMPAGGGDCNACHGAYFVRHANANHTSKVAMNSNCAGCHNGTQGTATGVPVDPDDNKVHDACTTCHAAGNGTLVGLAAAHPGGGDCQTCHGAYFTRHTNADHTTKVAMNARCSGCHSGTQGTADGMPVDPADDLVHDSCSTCHDAGNGTLVGLASGHSGGGDCLTCHLENRHHATVEAVNNNCTTTCHPAVDHGAMVVNTSPCSTCHATTAGTATGIPVSLTDTTLHKSCRSCHAFDGQGRGVLVNFTNRKGVNGTGTLPNGGTLAGQDGGGECTVCHTLATAKTMASMGSLHHSSTRAAQGQCEYCHGDPMPSWSPSAPGDNGTLSGLTPAWPTQMACRECHVKFSGGGMTVNKFTRSDYASYATDWTRSTAHTLPLTGNSINNYGICLGCHFVGSSKVPASAQVTAWHARPDKHGTGSGWAFFEQTASGAQGKSNYRSSCAGDQAHYLPGRASSGIGGFNIFAPNYGLYKNPLGLNYDFQNEGDDSVNYCSDYDTFMGPAASAPFIRISLPPLTQLGTTSSQSLPVFPSIAPASGTGAADDVRVVSAVWNGDNLYIIATTTSSAGCSSLTATYNGYNQGFAGTTNCVAIFPPAVVYTSSLPTVNVTTSNPSGMNVIGYPITAGQPPALDTTPPVASAVSMTPVSGSYVPTAFSLNTYFVDEESAVSSCAYTTDGATWTPGVVGGSTPLYTCTANPSAMGGSLTVNMRAVSAGGLGTATAIGRTVDAVAPSDGNVTVTPGYSQNSLAWTTATDAASGLRTTNTYEVRFQSGATPPTCTSGASLYQGNSRSYTHGGLSNGTLYSYRVCAYDNVNNRSNGVTGSGTPHDITPPAAGGVVATPMYGSYVPSAFTLSTFFTDAQSAVTACEYTTNGTSWLPGTVSGASPLYTCTANPSAMSGALTLNMRATSTGGLATATPLYMTVDQTPPTDGVLTVTAGYAQNSLAWSAASDSQSWLRYYNTYNVRFLTGATPPTCTSGTSLSLGTSRAYTHSGLIVGNTYSYRVCAYDNLNNVSLGATGSGVPTSAPPTLTSPTATAIDNSSATLGANVTAAGDTPVTARGTVWGTTANPTGNLLAEGGTSLGGFSQVRTGLPAGTRIYYRGYATNSTVTGYSPDGSFYTEPSAQAAGVGFSVVGQTGMTVNWTRGNGDGVIVLMKQGVAVDADPADGNYTGYTANSIFGNGTQVGSGNYVIYKGSGSSVAVTGLVAALPYSVAVYEYKGLVNSWSVDLGTNYKPSPARGGQTTLLAPPVLVSPTATAIDSTTAILGASILSDSGAAITSRGTVWGTAPNPTGNPWVEGGTTTGTFSLPRTGLPAGTKIFHRGYATNSIGTGYSPDGSFHTEPSNQASGVNFSAVGASGMTVNWTRGTGDGVVVLIKQGAAVDSDPVDGIYTGYVANSAFGFGTQIGSGNFLVYKGTGTSVAITGLNTGNTYYLAVYEYQGSVDTTGVSLGTNYKPSPASGSQTTSAVGGVYSYTFNYTGAVQIIAIPAGAINIQLAVKGGGGGGGRADGVGNQENGQNGHLVVIPAAVADTMLRVYVGGGGTGGSSNTSGSPGGWGYHFGSPGGNGEDDYGDCGDWAYGGAGGGGSSAILLDSNGTTLTEAAGGGGGRSSDWDGSCYYMVGGAGGGGGGSDLPGTTNPSDGGAGGAAGEPPSPGGNGQVIITYELGS